MRVLGKQVGTVLAKQRRLRVLCDLGRKRPILYVKPKMADFKRYWDLICKPNGKKYSRNVYAHNCKTCAEKRLLSMALVFILYFFSSPLSSYTVVHSADGEKER